MIAKLAYIYNIICYATTAESKIISDITELVTYVISVCRFTLLGSFQFRLMPRWTSRGRCNQPVWGQVGHKTLCLR